MVYPKLVKIAKIPVKVELDRAGLDVYGSPLRPVTFHAYCNYQSSSSVIYTQQKRSVQISGKALFDGDICPDITALSGRMEIFGETRTIVSGQKHRNPDGTVNYTELDLV